MSQPHEFYMRRCIELAQKALGKTYPNPMVGAVIVHDEKIIGEGYHKKAGENHAEINAIQSIKNPELIPHSTIYVSLEPCAHIGRTSSCASTLKELGIKRVVIGSMDYHDKVFGKGLKILEDAGVEIITGILEKECDELNKRFFTYHLKKRPYVMLKWAESADGFLDKDYKPTAISNTTTLQFAHQMRADEHAILVGTQTALNDNPSLTVRHVTGENPIRVLIDFDLKVPRHYNLYNNEAKTLIFNRVKNEQIGEVELIKVEKENFLEDLMSNLYEREVQSIIIEGGSYTLQHFIDHDFWDEALVIKNTDLYLEHGTKAPLFPAQAFETRHFGNNELLFFKKN